jgi:hypothetical protein
VGGAGDRGVVGESVSILDGVSGASLRTNKREAVVD